MPGDDKKVRYDIEVGADTKGADKASKSFDQVDESAKKAGKSVEDLHQEASKDTSINLDSSKATAEARGVHNAIQAANQAADDHASINIDGNKASAEAKKTKDAVDEAKKAADKPPSKRGFFARLRADMDELRSQFPLLDKAFKGMELAAKGPIAAVIALVTALTLAFKGLVASVRAYVSESRNIGKIDAALAQTGQLTKENRREVIALATEFETLTGVVRQDWVAVLTKLITFGSRSDTLGVDAKTVENLAGLLGGRDGLSQAVDLYARALQGEFGSFQELGFQLDLSASQHENIARVQQGAARGAGQLRAEARSAGGEVDSLGITARRTAEGIGRLFANTGILSAGINLLKNGLSAVNEFLPQTTSQLEGLQNRLPDLESAFRQTSESAKELSDQALKRVGEEAEIADSKLKTLIARLREQEQQALALTNAKAANALAQVDLDEANGDLKPGEASERRFQIREEANAEKVRIELAANNEELKRLREAIETAERNRQEALSAGAAKSEEINAEISARQALVDQSRAITDEQNSIASERADLLKTVDELQSLPSSLGAAGTGSGQGAFIANEANLNKLSEARRRLDALVARDEELNEQSGEIKPQADQAEKEIQELNSQKEAARVAAVATANIEADLKRDLAFRQESIERRNQTLGTVSGIEADTRSATREAARIRERKEAEAAEAERKRNEESARLDRESISLGSNIEQFAGRRLPESDLKQAIVDKARALDDGGVSQETKELEKALLEMFRAVEGSNHNLARQIQQIGQKVRVLTTQLENNRTP